MIGRTVANEACTATVPHIYFHRAAGPRNDAFAGAMAPVVDSCDIPTADSQFT